MKRWKAGMVILISAVAGGWLGLVLRGGISGVAEQPGAVTRPAAGIETEAQSLEHRTGNDSPLVIGLENHLRFAKGVARWLYWLEALEKATVQDMPRLVRLAGADGPALSLIADRWKELNVMDLVDTIIGKNRASLAASERDRLIALLFETWPANAEDCRNLALRIGGKEGENLDRNWRGNLISRFFQHDPELGLESMAAWQIHDYTPHLQGIAEWVSKDPAHAAEFAAARPVGSATQEIMETIGQEWARTDPAAAMKFGVGTREETRSAVARGALKTWAKNDLPAAAAWLAETDPATRNRLSEPFVEAWARSDPATALIWSESHLSGTTLARAAGGILRGAAGQDVAAAARLVEVMQPSLARATGAGEVAHTWIAAVSNKDKTVPAEFVSWLGNLDPHTVARAVSRSNFEWMNIDPDSLAAFLAEHPNREIPSYIYENMARLKVRKDPEGALAWAAQLPEDRVLKVGGAAYSEWRKTQQEQAAQWLRKLPPEDSRRTSYFEAAVRDEVFSMRAPERIATWDASDRAAAIALIKKMPMPPDLMEKALRTINGQ